MSGEADLLVIGDAMIDISVKPPRHRVGGAWASDILVSPGGLGNVAVSASSCGAITGFAGAVGNDAFGERYRMNLESNNVRTHLKISSSGTGLCVNLVWPDGERTMYTRRGANDDFRAHDLTEDTLQEYKMIFLSGFSLETGRSSSQIMEVTRKAREIGIRIALSGGAYNIIEQEMARFRELARLSEILILNDKEAAAFTGECELSKEIELLGRTTDTAVITTGPRGCIASLDGNTREFLTQETPVVDSTGAGDTFAGTFLGHLLRGEQASEAIKRALDAASQSVGHLGPRENQ